MEEKNVYYWRIDCFIYWPVPTAALHQPTGAIGSSYDALGESFDELTVEQAGRHLCSL